MSFPSLSAAGERRQARLRDARLLLVVTTRPDLEQFAVAAAEASVDALLLRDKAATEDRLRQASDVLRRVADQTGVLFVLNDLPGLAVQVGADGTHVGRGDVHPDHARRIVGPDLLIGRTVRVSSDLDTAADEDVDYLAVVDTELVPTAARHAAYPWFCACRDAPGSAEGLLDRGARRLVVHADACGEDPTELAWSLRRKLAANPVR